MVWLHRTPLSIVPLIRAWFVFSFGLSWMKLLQTFLDVFWRHMHSSLLGNCIGVKFLRHSASLFSFNRHCQTFPKWFSQFILLLAHHEGIVLKKTYNQWYDRKMGIYIESYIQVYVYILIKSTKHAIAIKSREKMLFSINGPGAIIYPYGII